LQEVNDTMIKYWIEINSDNNHNVSILNIIFNKNEIRFTRINNWKEIFDYISNYRKEK